MHSIHHNQVAIIERQSLTSSDTFLCFKNHLNLFYACSSSQNVKPRCAERPSQKHSNNSLNNYSWDVFSTAPIVGP